MTRVLMFFLDGVGIGRKDPAENPLLAARLPVLAELLGGTLPTLRHRGWGTPRATLLPLDATLGVPGLPQSGTGQTALFTGVNAARLIGKHFGPFPYSTLRPVIEAHSIFQRLQLAGRSSCFANAFPQKFFDYFEKRKSRTSVTTYSCMTAGIELRREANVLDGTGVSADITGGGWAALGHSRVGAIAPSDAGRRLAALTRSYDFVLFEYWKTDPVGHDRNMPAAVQVLETFDAFFGGALAAIDPADTLVVLTSDHGNIEDLSTKTHTRNPVPLILAGHRHAEVAKRVLHFGGRTPDLTHVLPTLMEVLGAEHGQPHSP
ncbi:MAG: alkaline phosphatase family protein [Bacteroidetes bacterium]|nr:alkaline phosphatase family protein [Bacteroidota bacterium]